jgi:hypothetical protein
VASLVKPAVASVLQGEVSIGLARGGEERLTSW